MKWIIYNLAFPLVFLCMLPRFLLRMWRRGGYRSHFCHRLAFYSTNTLARLAARRRVWIHAVSVGEIYVALRLMRELRSLAPGTAFTLTTTTSTGHAIGAARIEADDVLLYFPVDLPNVMRAAIRAINPSALILVENEMWPNLIRLLAGKNIPVMLVNGRLSARSFHGYRRLPGFMSEILGKISLICAQSQEDKARFDALGANPQKTHDLGTMKYDMAQAAALSIAETAGPETIGMEKDAMLLVGGSTWPGEEKALLEIYAKLRPSFPRLRLVLVPRHAERAKSVAKEIIKAGFTLARRSRMRGEPAGTGPDVLLGDTTGELKTFYAAAAVVFVGKSLACRGGQNMIEPAAMGKAVIVGPHTENFDRPVRDLIEAGALLRARDAPELESAISRLLADEPCRSAMGARAKALVASKSGVAAASARLILKMFPNAFGL